jgi:hypothetical protein
VVHHPPVHLCHTHDNRLKLSLSHGTTDGPTAVAATLRRVPQATRSNHPASNTVRHTALWDAVPPVIGNHAVGATTVPYVNSYLSGVHDHTGVTAVPYVGAYRSSVNDTQ